MHILHLRTEHSVKKSEKKKVKIWQYLENNPAPISAI